MEQHSDIGNYQVIVCNIHYSRESASRRVNFNDLPEQIALDIPQSVLNQAKKSKNDFYDVIEQFAYNLLSRKFGIEVCSCQVWLPPAE